MWTEIEKNKEEELWGSPDTTKEDMRKTKATSIVK